MSRVPFTSQTFYKALQKLVCNIPAGAIAIDIRLRVDEPAQMTIRAEVLSEDGAPILTPDREAVETVTKQFRLVETDDVVDVTTLGSAARESVKRNP